MHGIARPSKNKPCCADSVLRTRVCNALPAAVETINSSFNFGVSAFPLEVCQVSLACLFTNPACMHLTPHLTPLIHRSAPCLPDACWKPNPAIFLACSIQYVGLCDTLCAPIHALTSLKLQHSTTEALREAPLCLIMQGGQSFKDPNILGHHFHGHYGRPGTDGAPCNPPPADGTTCFRGDNIFADINPGNCVEYEYDIPAVHSPGTFW